jgi:hypothetical protein
MDEDLTKMAGSTGMSSETTSSRRSLRSSLTTLFHSALASTPPLLSTSRQPPRLAVSRLDSNILKESRNVLAAGDKERDHYLIVPSGILSMRMRLHSDG